MSLTIRNSRSYGYTLIEMALALMVIGILLAGFLAIYTQYQTEEKISKTTNRVNSAIASIQKYRSVYGAFPCPAPMNLGRSALPPPSPPPDPPLYGKASNYSRYLPSGTVPLLAGQCAEGICIEQNTRADLSGTPTLRVRLGAIPFRDMQLDESDTYDAYGSRLWYAVTEELCNLPTFNETRGAIKIINDLNETQTAAVNFAGLTSSASSAAFIVISPGVNKVGGYGLEGTVQTPCTTGTQESENCRDVSLAISATTSATYRTQLVQEGNANAYFDDVVEFFSAAQTQLWRRTAPGAEDILDLANNSIGIGVSSPSATLDIGQSAVSTLTKPVSPALPVPGVYYQGDVTPTNIIAPNREHGALRVGPSTSKLKSDIYCSQAGDNCFRPENIMGGTGINCPAGSYPVGIKSNTTTHDAEFTCTPIAINCPPGETFAGFNTSGGNLVPNCSSATSFASCPATTKTLCSAGDVGLTPTAHGRWSSLISKGSCRESYYYCDNGNWVQPWGAWGSCVDTPTVTAGVACNSVDECWTGTYTLTTYSCSAGTWTFATDCTCTGCSRTVSSLCPSPLTGSGAVTRYDYVCDPSSPHSPAVVDPLHLAGTVITPSSCSCTLSPYNTFYDCPAGYIRDPSAPHLVPTDWPGDIKKGIYELVNVDGSCTHVNSGTIDSHYCTCDTADQYSTIEPPPPSCKKAKSGSRVVNGTSYDWKYEVRKTTINSAGCTPNPFTIESAAQLEDLDTYWREQAGSYSTTTSSKASSTPVVGERCDCGTQAGSTKACVKANPSGGWDVYSCQCGS